jgi:hypothetical protein
MPEQKTLYSPEKTSQALAQQAESPLDSDEDDIRVDFDTSANLYRIDFPFDGKRLSIVATLKSVKGVEYDDDAKAWAAPVEERAAVQRAIAKMRVQQAVMPVSYDALNAEVKAEYKGYPIEKFPKRVAKTRSDETAPKSQITHGPVLNFNEHYLAMMDMSREEQPRIVIHERPLLRAGQGKTEDGQDYATNPSDLKVGQRIKVAYACGRGVVSPAPMKPKQPSTEPAQRKAGN